MHLLLQEEELDRRSMEQELWKAEQYVDMALQYQRLDKDGRDLVLKEYPLSSLVKKGCKNMASVLIYNKTAIHLEDMAAAVLTDEKWFLFVLEQLLGNAVKYTAKTAAAASGFTQRRVGEERSWLWRIMASVSARRIFPEYLNGAIRATTAEGKSVPRESASFSAAGPWICLARRLP